MLLVYWCYGTVRLPTTKQLFMVKVMVPLVKDSSLISLIICLFGTLFYSIRFGLIQLLPTLTCVFYHNNFFTLSKLHITHGIYMVWEIIDLPLEMPSEYRWNFLAALSFFSPSWLSGAWWAIIKFWRFHTASFLLWRWPTLLGYGHSLTHVSHLIYASIFPKLNFSFGHIWYLLDTLWHMFHNSWTCPFSKFKFQFWNIW